jgi:hypothetical protein
MRVSFQIFVWRILACATTGIAVLNFGIKQFRERFVRQ